MEDYRPEIVDRFHRVLLDSVFDNHSQLHPRELKGVAELEADALISDMNSFLESARDHGMNLCKRGFSRMTLNRLMQVIGELMRRDIEDEFVHVRIFGRYQNLVMDGYAECREARL